MFSYKYARIYALFAKMGSYYNFPFSLTIQYEHLSSLTHIALHHSFIMNT